MAGESGRKLRPGDLVRLPTREKLVGVVIGISLDEDDAEVEYEDAGGVPTREEFPVRRLKRRYRAGGGES